MPPGAAPRRAWWLVRDSQRVSRYGFVNASTTPFICATDRVRGRDDARLVEAGVGVDAVGAGTC